MTADSDWSAILFDLDGTVADTVDMILACYRHTMHAHLGEVPPDERWLSGMGTPLVTQLQAFARSQEEGEAMLETYQTYQRSIHDSMVAPFPGKWVSTSLSYPLHVVVAAPELLVGQSIHLDSLLNEAIEEQPAGSRCSPVEPEGELIQVVVEVRLADAAMVGSHPPTLQQRCDSVDARHGYVGRELAGPQTPGTMLIAMARKWNIAGPPVRADGRPLTYSTLDEGDDARR